MVFNDVLLSAPWKAIMKASCTGPKGRRLHINITEVRAQLKSIDARPFDATYMTKQIYGMDSQVGLGVLSKGRSASYWLNEECRADLPSVLGRRHYPGYCFSPTRMNPADHPTRGTDIPPQHTPGYLCAAAAGDLEAFDVFAQLPPQSRASSSWARFFVRLRMPQQLERWPM